MFDGKARPVDWIQAGAALALVVITAKYTYYARNQVIETRKAITGSAKQFVTSERPYVGLEGGSPRTEGSDPIRLEVHETVQWRVTYTNYGKSPALHVSFTEPTKVFSGETAAAEADRYFQNLPQQGTSTETLWPNDRNTLHATPAESADLLTQDAIDYIKANDGGLYLVGRIEYEDGAGNRYYTNFCQRRFKGPVTDIEPCATHNEIGEISKD